MKNADGVALTSIAHPVAPWYRRVWLWLRRLRLSPDSLETIEIEIRETTQGQRILNSIYDDAFSRSFRNMGLRRSEWVDDKEIEKEVQEKGLTAPRVTLADIEACIAWEYYTTGDRAFGTTTAVIGPAYKAHQLSDITPLACLTLCVLMLRNGFTVTGESACASPENFDEAIGRKVARQKAVDKIWMLEGYLLKERLYSDAINRSSGGGDFGDS